jgi:hypothetical protein
MQIAYTDPLLKAWNRMKQALFKPFDISKWFVVGFTAFLAGLASGGSPMLNWPGGNARGRNDGSAELPDITQIPRKVAEWLSDHPIIFILILAGIIIVIVIALVLTWLASRGAFMFLHNVVGDRAQIAEPWRQYKMQGNSLFLWRLGYGLISLIFIIPLILFAIFTFLPIVRDHDIGNHLLPLIICIAAFALLCLIGAYISLFTTNFIVPIMYKHNLKTMEAWKVFMPILTSHFGSFILYGLFLLLLLIGIGIATLLGICVSCCILLLLLLIPYINSVVWLPVNYTYRAFSLEFLAQFGEEYTLFPISEPILPASPPIQLY